MVIANLNSQLRALREIQAPQHVQPAPDRENGYRVSSAAFMPGSDKTVSVDLEESLAEAGLAVIARYPSLPRAVALVTVRVGQVIAQQLSIRHDPIIGNPHHGVIEDAPVRLSRKERKAAARSLADAANFLVAFDPTELAKYAAKTD